MRTVLLGACVVLSLVLAGNARAQAASGPPLERVDVVGARKTEAKPDTVKRRPWHDQPRFVMARSLVIPGWGQLHNRAWYKALLVAGAEGYLGVRIADDSRALNGYLRDLGAVRVQLQDTTLTGGQVADLREVENGLVNRYNSRLDQRLGRQWMLGAALAYAIIDAYVDANFRGFDVEFQNDPALPGGPGSLPQGSGNGTGVRLLLRRHF